MTDPRPIPPRYWWLKRLSLLYALLVAGTVGLRYAWLASATRKVDARIAACRAAGEPTLPEDFAVPPVPEADNAADALNGAMKVLTDNARTLYRFDPGRNVRLPVQTGVTPAQVVHANRPALDNVRRARSLPGVDWHVKFKSPTIAVVLPKHHDQRLLVEFLQYAALDAHVAGREAEAVELCRDALFVSRAIGGQPFVVSNNTAMGADRLACTVIATITPTLRTDDPAARRASLALIRELLDDRHIRDNSVYAMLGERAMHLDVARLIGRGLTDPATLTTGKFAAREDTVAQRFVAWWASPIVEVDALWALEDTTRWIDAVRSPVKPPGGSLPKSNFGFATSPHDAIFHPVSRSLYGSWTTWLDRSYITQARRRETAIDLAARLYALDHKRPPAKIEDLVPDYLPAVPLDPTRGGPATLPAIPATAPFATTAPSG